MLFLAVFIFTGATLKLRQLPRVSSQVEMQVALPLLMQVALAGGDRYLAADIATIRALIVSTEKMRPDGFSILAKVQEDASWLNPAHEDNYYLATAVLPWNNEVAATQEILQRATAARPFDYQPAFYYAFNESYFLGDVVGASRWLEGAASKLPDEDQRLMMQNLAARMLDRSDDLQLAIDVVETMAKQATRKDFRSYLYLRVARLRTLQSLRAAAKVYEQRRHAPLRDLQQLVECGLIRELPKDPFGFGYAVQANGNIVILNAKSK